MKVGSTLRSYIQATIGPWVIAINRILNDASGFIQSNVNISITNANAASDSASGAAAAEAAAVTSQASAAGSAATAVASATAAQQSLTAVNAIVTSFNKVYLGAKPSDPTTDNNGQPLINGAMYLNTTDTPEKLRIYENGQWVDSDGSVEQALLSAQASAAAAAASESNAAADAAAAEAAAAAALAAELAAEAAATRALGAVPALGTGTALEYVRVNAANTGYELRAPAVVLNDIGGAPITSAALLGVPTAPLADKDTATGQLATTSFVVNQASSTLPAQDTSGGLIGTSFRYARSDHAHPTDTSRAAAGGSIQQGFTGSLFLAAWGVPQGNGVVSTGGYSFANDGVNDTGLYSDRDGYLYVYNNGVLTITFDSNNTMTVNKAATFLTALNSNGTLNINGTGSQVSITSPAGSNGLAIANAEETLLTLDDVGNLAVLGNVTSGGVITTNAIVEGSLNFVNNTSRMFYDTTNKRLSVQSGTYLYNFNPDGSLVIQGNFTTTGIVTGLSLALSKDSNSSIGNLDLIGQTPHINWHFNNTVAPNVQMINSADGEISLINSGSGYLQAQFGKTYWTLGYATTTTAGLRLVGQNGGNLVVLSDTKTATSTTTTTLFSLGTTGASFSVPVTYASTAPLTVSGTAAFNGVSTFTQNLYLQGAAITYNGAATVAQMTLDFGHFYFGVKSATPVLTIDCTPGNGNVGVKSSVQVTAPSLRLSNGNNDAIISKDLNDGDIVFQLNNGTATATATIKDDGTIVGTALQTTGSSTAGSYRAAQGISGFGYSFTGDVGYDSGMFSNQDGQVLLVSNGVPFLTLNATTATNPGTISLIKSTTVTGTFTVNTGIAALNGGATVPTPVVGDNTSAVPNTAWVVGVQHTVAQVLTRYGNASSVNGQASDYSFTVTVPAGCTRFFYEGGGAGGGGSQCQANSINGNVSGPGGGSGAYGRGYFSVLPGTVYTVVLGASGYSQTAGGRCEILDAQGNLIVQFSGGNGAGFPGQGNGPGAGGGTATINPGVQQTFTQPGGWGYDGQSGSGAISYGGNGAPGPYGGGGRAGNQRGTDATGVCAGGGGAYDGSLTGNLYQGGSGGPSFLSWWFSI